jgi:hypothetical protein
LPIKIQLASCCCIDAKSRFQIILTTHNAHGAIHYPKIQMPKKIRNKKEIGIRRIQKRKKKNL